MDDDEETVELDGELHDERELAWKFHDGKLTVWLPKQLCKWDPDTKKMTIPSWLATDRGLV